MKQIAIWLIRFYVVCVSPYTLPRCRFQPTCAAYAIQALDRHGLFRGGLFLLRRIVRCHPWGSSGYDPVPPVPPKSP